MARATKLRPGWIVPIVACLMLATGCGRAGPREAERRIRDAAPELIGSARQYRVHVGNSSSRVGRRQTYKVVIDGDDVQLSNGLLVDHVHIDLIGVEVDRKDVRQIEKASFEVSITEASVDEFLAGEAPEGETIRRTRVSFGINKQAAIEAERVTLGGVAAFKLNGQLRIADPFHVELDTSRLSVVGLPANERSVQFLKERFESALDVSHSLLSLQVTELRTQPGSITLAGTIDIKMLVTRMQDVNR